MANSSAMIFVDPSTVAVPVTGADILVNLVLAAVVPVAAIDRTLAPGRWLLAFASSG